MAEVVPIRSRRAPGAAWNALVARLRERLGEELEGLSNEQMRGLEARIAGRTAADSGEALPRRIRLLGQLIAGLEATEPGTVWDDRAGYGSRVFVRDLQSGEVAVYTLMAGSLVEDDPSQVALDSPLGTALLGCRPGDEAEVQTAGGRRTLRVFAVHTLPQSLGMLRPGSGGAA